MNLNRARGCEQDNQDARMQSRQTRSEDVISVNTTGGCE